MLIHHWHFNFLKFRCITFKKGTLTILFSTKQKGSADYVDFMITLSRYTGDIHFYKL